MTLLDAIENCFTSLLSEDKIASRLLESIKKGTATFAEAEEYAARIGELLSDAIMTQCDILLPPNSPLTIELLEQFLPQMLNVGYRKVTDASAMTMEALGKKAGLKLKADIPTIDKNRVTGLVNKAASYETYEDARWLFGDPIVNFSQNVCDRLIQNNVDVHHDIGLMPKITRKAMGKCCKWCRALEGVYTYPVEREVYQRHENCRCLVLYDPGNGKVQDAHTKQWYDSAVEAKKAATAEERKQKLEKWEKQAARYPEARKEILRRVKSGEYSLKLKHQKYLQHVQGTQQFLNATKGRTRHQSYLTITEKEAQDIINRYTGLGDPDISKFGVPENREYFSTGRKVGYYFDGERYRPTDRVAICHAKEGSHIYPVKPLEIML